MLCLSLIDKLYELLILIQCEDCLRQISVSKVGHYEILSHIIFIKLEIAEDWVVCNPEAPHFFLLELAQRSFLALYLAYDWSIKHYFNKALLLYESKKLRCILNLT